MSDRVYINGKLFSFHSSILKIGDEPFSGWTSMSYSQKRTRGKGFGASRSGRPRGRTAGKMETDPLKIKFYSDSAQDVRQYLQDLSPDLISYGETVLPISLQLYEPSLGEIFRLFKDAVLMTEPGSVEEGTDPTFEELEFDIMWIETNGGTLFDSTQLRF
jgi:hypothetical protein